jgi:hypothetical protein
LDGREVIRGFRILPSLKAPGSTPIILRSFYWSSTEYNKNSALLFAMNFGNMDDYPKNNPNRVRAIRRIIGN